MAARIGANMVHQTSAIKVFTNRADIMSNGLRGATISKGALHIDNVDAFKGSLPTLAANAADFGDRSAPADVQALSRWIIGEGAQQLNVKLASPQEAYVAIAEGRINREMSFPAVNIRVGTLDCARALFKAANDNKVGALITEIARSEMGYTNQSPAEYAAVLQAAAMLEGFEGPLFLQGDHVQLKSAPVREGGTPAAKEINTHRKLIQELLAAGFGSIDLDMSPFERRTEENLSFEEQQAENARLTAEKIADVRALEKELGIPWTVLLGGETGEVGKMNTRKEDLEAYAEGIIANMKRLGIDPALGIRKIAVNDGTAHGGTPLPDGSVADVSIAFEILRMATDFGKKYGWAGSVQHGASTLPNNAFSLFPQNKAVEVHLATGFQNITFDNGIYKVKGAQSEIEQFLADKFRGDWKAGKTFAQFAYSTRKQATGPFKWMIWTMPEDVRAKVAENLYDQFAFLFGQLGVVDTKDLIAKHTTLHDFHLAYPEEVGTSSAASGKEDTSDLAD
ncbi:MAG: class II fructose-bisphosphate aldolase [Proteobacteria bacterium]|nr:class II fructose-bisphosphate aldolase [Pseudomonadota bacterium]